jgi:hypothetical protein
MPEPDPIVDEVRAARDSIARQAGYDIARIAEAVREREAAGGGPVVTLPPRKPTVALGRLVESSRRGRRRCRCCSRSCRGSG